MRSRTLVALTLFAPWALAGCEDGPNQSYSPAPNGAANNWNNSNTPGVTDPSKQGYIGGGSTGTNKVEICTAPVKQKRWAAMVQEPIIPPRGGAGIDLAGGDTWAGITIEEAEKINCQSSEAGDVFGDGTPVNYWGDNAEVWFSYNAATRKGIFMNFWPGYVGPQGEGAVKATYTPPGGGDPEVFKIMINQFMTLNDQPYPIDWFTNVFPGQVNKIGRALLQTYAPFLSDENINGCYGGLCITGSFGNVAYIYLPVIGIGIWTPNTQATSTSNIIDRIDVYLNKVLPFAMSYPMLKLDKDGPFSRPVGGTLGVKQEECVLKFGLNYGSFLSNCVRVTDDQTKDDIEQNKLFGGFSHGREQYHFAISGMSIDFARENLPWDQIVADTDRPVAEDVSREFTVDQSVMGRFVNDRYRNVDMGPRDNHGMGLVYMEYARIVQKEMNKWLTSKGEATHELGDPDCLAPNIDPITGLPPNGCTGFEGFVTCAPFDPAAPPEFAKLSQGYDPTLNWPSANCVTTGCNPGFANCDNDANTPTPGTKEATTKGAGCEALVGYPRCGMINTSMQAGLKPGHPPSLFCNDPVDDPMLDPVTGAPTQGFTDCISGDLWVTSFDRVLHVFGHDVLGNMPYEIRDNRFFFHAYMEALVKYLMTEGEHPAGDATISQVHAMQHNRDDLHFDSAGAGQWETAAYLDRRNVVATGQPPIEFTITADIKNGIFNDYQFGRQLYRGERLLYASVWEDKTKPIGAGSTAQLTNIFGSPVIAAGWTDSGYRTAYECATMDPATMTDAKWAAELKACNGQHPPMNKNPVDNKDIERDEDGMPILLHYQGAFAGKATAFALKRGSPIKVTDLKWQIASATMEMPVYKNPYDSSSGVLDMCPDIANDPNGCFGKKLIPFEPKQPGLGFDIPVNGQLDKFIMTAHSDLSGRQISLQLAFDWTLDPITMQPKGDGQVDLLGLHCDDFLGDVFLCQDSATGDLLKARMYTTTDYLLDWLIEHPAAMDECEIIIRYSPFGNYPDYISSLKNGVMVGVNQGGGKGRIIDAQMWIPGL